MKTTICTCEIPENDMQILEPCDVCKQKSEPRYSGPNRSGVCVCGHSWEEHHLGVVMNREYADATGEAYLPQECEAYGFNECGGLKYENGKWVNHCQSYKDSGIIN